MTTAPTPTTTIAIVASNAFDYGPINPGNEVLVGPAGREFSEFVLRRLVECGATKLNEPVPGEEGWTFDVELDRERYRIFVHWAPVGYPPVDRWVIQTRICKSLLRSLFGCRTVIGETTSLVRELHHVLDGANEIEQMHWVSLKEFSELY